jgi:hypothetical protein
MPTQAHMRALIIVGACLVVKREAVTSPEVMKRSGVSGEVSSPIPISDQSRSRLSIRRRSRVRKTSCPARWWAVR